MTCLSGRHATGPIALLVFVLYACGGPVEVDQPMRGWLVMGHEVRSFRPCGTQQELWLMGDSPALDEIKAEYSAASQDTGPYTPLFVHITGRRVTAPGDGFGANFSGGLTVNRVEQVWPQGDCD
jgi:hypothetical protein